MSSYVGRLVRALGAFAMVTLVAGCSSVLHPNAVAGEVDVRTLDIDADSSTRPPTLPSYLGIRGYAQLEAARLADAVLSPYEVEPKYFWGAAASAQVTPESVTQYLADPVVKVLYDNGFVVGFSTGAADSVTPLTKAVYGTHDHEGIRVTVLRFPDAASARSAAQQTDAVDMALNPQNTPVKLPKYADAFAHWRPTVPTLGSTLAHGVFVVNILADARTTDLTRLTEMTQQYLAAELPVLDKFVPTPAEKIPTLQQDPDHILVRTLHEGAAASPPDGGSEIVYTLRAYLNYVQDQGTRYPVMRRAGIDRVAVAPAAYVFRARDSAAAVQFVADSAHLGDADARRDVDPPEGVPNTMCVENYTAPAAARFRCFVAYRRYAALVLGQQLWQTQQRAASQYALLANAQATLPN
ncbi:DUF7373 family lipoprotein [Nocardia jiangxiensis]|uniref:Lipoprotein n=1 Tax=Nocardia jiangxiensis TaxID=282685 RepID=A0ABW6S089_9NOCA|nr:hypothetical protein [Nocardia jiangxiensis]